MVLRILLSALVVLVGLTLLIASIVSAEPAQPEGACPLPAAPAGIRTCPHLANYPSPGPGITCRCPSEGDCGGTLGNDRIYGTNGNDLIGGYAGNDVICGFGGSDRLFGDPGKDYLNGGGGSPDECYGGSGLDVFDVSCEIWVQQ